MKTTFIIGNWKSYKTVLEAREWFQTIKNYELKIKNDNEIIVCVPFTLLSLAKDLINQYNLPIKVGAQDISPFAEGKYTGEINGKQIVEFAEYVIIGHSERRQYFGESEEIINKKIEQAIDFGLTPIVCVSDISQVDSSQFTVHGSQLIIAYEPLFAIGSGTPDSPENADNIAQKITAITKTPVIYGGSVTSVNVHSFTSMPSISGVLPGGASLDAKEFIEIVNNA